eukprot:10866291-Karenia_brevis.AAC.1
MSERSRSLLKETCEVCEARIQTAKVGGKLKFWLQPEWTSTAKGGFVWADKEDGSTWMNLGGDR